MNNFIWSCLCPSVERIRCGTIYDLTAWGSGISEIVKAYKDRKKTQEKFSDISELYEKIKKGENT